MHCNGPGELANESYKQFWRNVRAPMRCPPLTLAVQLYDLRDYEDGPCNFYFIQRRKCFARYHPGAHLPRCCPSREC